MRAIPTSLPESASTGRGTYFFLKECVTSPSRHEDGRDAPDDDHDPARVLQGGGTGGGRPPDPVPPRGRHRAPGPDPARPSQAQPGRIFLPQVPRGQAAPDG